MSCWVPSWSGRRRNKKRGLIGRLTPCRLCAGDVSVSVQRRPTPLLVPSPSLAHTRTWRGCGLGPPVHSGWRLWFVGHEPPPRRRATAGPQMLRRGDRCRCRAGGCCRGQARSSPRCSRIQYGATCWSRCPRYLRRLCLHAVLGPACTPSTARCRARHRGMPVLGSMASLPQEGCLCKKETEVPVTPPLPYRERVVRCSTLQSAISFVTVTTLWLAAHGVVG